MKPFVPLLRFPMMSTQSLLDDVLPVHGQLFAKMTIFCISRCALSKGRAI